MKAGIFFTESEPILAPTAHHFFAHPKLVEKFAEKGITKFIAYEVSIEKVEEKYGKQPRLEPDSNGDRELRIIDSDEKQIFNNFSIKDLGEPVLYEKQRHHSCVPLSLSSQNAKHLPLILKFCKKRFLNSSNSQGSKINPDETYFGNALILCNIFKLQFAGTVPA